MPHQDLSSRPVDVIVIGAGPAGSVTAALLHRVGLSVRIVEKSRFPRFVVGESLLPRCMDILDEAGLLEAVAARGYQVKNGALFVRGDERSRFDFAQQFTPGRTWTWQVPRADFDQTLARAVEERGVPIDWATRVSTVDFIGTPTLQVIDERGRSHTLQARFIVDASGYGRVLPRLLDLHAPSKMPTRTALFTHVRGDRRPIGSDEGRGWICLHPRGGWIWITPFSDGTTSIGAVGTPDFFERFGGGADDAVRLRAILESDPVVSRRLAGASFLFPPERLTGYSVSVKRLHGDGYCLVGNATEFLDPVFSSGVTLALESASRAAGLIDRELAGGVVDWDRDYTAHVMRGMDVFRTFVNHWYSGGVPELLFSERGDPDVRSQICSVLAGYVWDETNPIVRDHARRVPQLAQLARAVPRRKAS